MGWALPAAVLGTAAWSSVLPRSHAHLPAPAADGRAGRRPPGCRRDLAGLPPSPATWLMAGQESRRRRSWPAPAAYAVTTHQPGQCRGQRTGWAPGGDGSGRHGRRQVRWPRWGCTPPAGFGGGTLGRGHGDSRQGPDRLPEANKGSARPTRRQLPPSVAGTDHHRHRPARHHHRSVQRRRPWHRHWRNSRASSPKARPATSSSPAGAGVASEGGPGGGNATSQAISQCGSPLTEGGAGHEATGDDHRFRNPLRRLQLLGNPATNATQTKENLVDFTDG